MNAETIKNLIERTYAINKKNGFWPDGELRSEHQIRALISSEVSEMLEAKRKDRHLNNFNSLEQLDKFADASLGEKYTQNWISLFKTSVKDTVECELADVVIRCLDTLGGLVYKTVDNSYLNLTHKSIDNSLIYYFDSIISVIPFGFTMSSANDIFFIQCNYLQTVALGFNPRSERFEILMLRDSCCLLIATCFYLAKLWKIDLEKIISVTLFHNSLREYKHGVSF